MNNFKIKYGFILFVMLLSYTGLYAQQSKAVPMKTKISVEIDPSTFAFNGYGIHLRIQPKNSSHLLIGAGTYALDYPGFLVDLDKLNKNMGWNIRLNHGYGLFGEYHFSEVNKNWFVGSQVSLQEYKIKNDQIDGSEKYTNLLLMAYGGYSWQPFNIHFYVKPWAGLGYTSKVSGTNSLGDMEYNISPVTFFATLHLGYTF